MDGRLLAERTTYELSGAVEGFVGVDGERIELTTDRASFFRNHSWGFMGGRGGPKLYAAPRPVPKRPAGLRQWVLFHAPDHGGFFFEDPNGRAASGKGAILTDHEIIPVVRLQHELEFHPGDRRLKSGTFSLTDIDGQQRDYRIRDLGWVYCQGGGYFGGFNDKLGQGVYRGEYHQ